jgi:hypothetical protein
MLVCDILAACCTVSVFILLKVGLLRAWHLYFLNAVNGLMNTVQRPASEVAITLITPKKYYQKTSALQSFSGSLITILHPMLAYIHQRRFGKSQKGSCIFRVFLVLLRSLQAASCLKAYGRSDGIIRKLCDFRIHQKLRLVLVHFLQIRIKVFN